MPRLPTPRLPTMATPETGSSPRIRRARASDATALARLTGQLGYPAGADRVLERLAALRGRSQIVLVAEVDGACAAWLHVQLRPGLTSELTAQVMGLVVEAEQRSAGIGARLLLVGEAWARARGARRMVIGTRVEREAAHRFYGREGYRLEKTWRVLAKDL